MKIALPGSDAIEALIRVKEDNDCIFITGFFYKYDVKINDLSIDIEPKENFEYNPKDIFHLAWYV
ncbi:hypothetical protein [Chryseobacterium kwangjuense]|uniref:Uncharacterized protein n=1 Tax=Chryseobacterium kwangjuense TaxID=267125 RepID=A0A135WJ70_9FLAO|nr:hypothetical protein [Chryseobacterium kwangjuense]KXH84943.1 hypothetical protein AU378_04080 [Chryseobacterium kwangjuense]